MQVTKIEVPSFIYGDSETERLLFPGRARTGGYLRRKMRQRREEERAAERRRLIASPNCSCCGLPREHPGTEFLWCDSCRALDGGYPRFVTSNPRGRGRAS
jgi:hypothetical protein